MPKLAVLVTASPFDAAIHDAMASCSAEASINATGRTACAEICRLILARSSKASISSRYIQREPTPRIFVYHSVGAGDPILAEDVKEPLKDGLPNTLPEWIAYNGLTHLKIKLNGNDLGWDVERVRRIERAVLSTKRKIIYCLDFNENCPDIRYFMSFLHDIQKLAGSASIDSIRRAADQARPESRSRERNVRSREAAPGGDR